MIYKSGKNMATRLRCLHRTNTFCMGEKAYQSEAGKQKAREEAERRKNPQTQVGGNKTGIIRKMVLG